MVALLRLHWKDRFGDTSRTRLLPRLDDLPGLTNLRKNRPARRFFRFKTKIHPARDELKHHVLLVYENTFFDMSE